MMHHNDEKLPSMKNTIWDYYQNETPEVFAGSKSRLSYLLNQIQTKGRILNVGAGAGLCEELALNRGFLIYSLDPNERSILALRERLGLDDRAQVGDCQSIPFPDNYFQAVIISEVIEHLPGEAHEKALAEIYRVLVPGGIVLGTVPSREDLNEHRVICPACGQCFHRWGHVQTFDTQRIKGLLSSIFHIKTVSERYFVTWSQLNWKGKLHSLARLLLSRVGFHVRHENIVFIGVKPGTLDPKKEHR